MGKQLPTLFLMDQNQNQNFNQQFGFMDILFFISFFIQLQNQNNIIRIQDIQKEVDRAIDLLNEHLQNQDKKLDKILEALKDENN